MAGIFGAGILCYMKIKKFKWRIKNENIRCQPPLSLEMYFEKIAKILVVIEIGLEANLPLVGCMALLVCISSGQKQRGTLFGEIFFLVGKIVRPHRGGDGEGDS